MAEYVRDRRGARSPFVSKRRWKAGDGTTQGKVSAHHHSLRHGLGNEPRDDEGIKPGVLGNGREVLIGSRAAGRGDEFPKSTVSMLTPAPGPAARLTGALTISFPGSSVPVQGPHTGTARSTFIFERKSSFPRPTVPVPEGPGTIAGGKRARLAGERSPRLSEP
jgi:hypothetical protein